MRSWTWLALPLVFTACLEDDEPSPTPTPHVFFVSPSEGDRIGRDFRIELATTNFVLKPAGAVAAGTGYLTVFIDESCLPEGEIIRPSGTRLSLTGGESFVDIALDPGPHRLCAQASDGRGVALGVVGIVDIVVIDARVRIVSPTWGAAIGQKVRFTLEAEGIEIEPSGEARPGAGHFYLVIDEECPPEAFPISLASNVVNLADGAREIEIEVSRGQHEVWLGVADGDDIALAPRTRVEFYSY